MKLFLGLLAPGVVLLAACARPDSPPGAAPDLVLADVTVIDVIVRDRGVILDATISTIPRAVGEEAASWAIEVTRRADAMGIPISTGTDGPSLFDEIEMLVDSVGLTPLEVIGSATLVGAAVIGVADDFGSVEVGKVADLVVYADDPSVDVTALQRPSFVIRGGQLVRARS